MGGQRQNQVLERKAGETQGLAEADPDAVRGFCRGLIQWRDSEDNALLAVNAHPLVYIQGGVSMMSHQRRTRNLSNAFSNQWLHGYSYRQCTRALDIASFLVRPASMELATATQSLLSLLLTRTLQFLGIRTHHPQLGWRERLFYLLNPARPARSLNMGGRWNLEHCP